MIEMQTESRELQLAEVLRNRNKITIKFLKHEIDPKEYRMERHNLDGQIMNLRLKKSYVERTELNHALDAWRD